MILCISKANEFEKKIEGKQIVLFGASSAARHFLLDYDVQENIRFIVDNDKKKSNTKYVFKNYKYDIFTPDIFTTINMENTIIVITSTYHTEIIEQLNQIDVLCNAECYNYLLFEHENYCDILNINKNKKILICIGAVSYNRGSEALVSSLAGICKSSAIEADVYLSSSEPTFSSDYKVKNIDYYIKQTNNGKDILDSFITCVQQMDVIIVVGADNYTYEYNLQKKMNRLINILENESHAVCIMYDLSIEKSCINEDLINSFQVFDYITAREEFSYQNLLEFFSEKLIYSPDPAFLLEIEEETKNIKKYILDKKTVGLNLSDLIISGKYEKQKSNIIRAYVSLIEYILNNTNYNILLIPHVMNNTDLFALNIVYKDYINNPRIILVEEESLQARELKKIISQCQYYIGARTHSIIAAYSSYIPAISIGYSIKSFGIANDIFGNKANNYVVDINSITSEDTLIHAFQFLVNERDTIICTLKDKLPSYLQKIYRMKVLLKNILYDKNNIGCCGCEACEQICPANCIIMHFDREGFAYPITDYNKCISCDLCSKVCPIENKVIKKEEIVPEFYCLYNNDSEIMANSSSGGIFSSLAEEIIHKGGSVYGAESINGMVVSHSRADTLEDYKKFRKSKYLQSSINSCYKKVKNDLKQGLMVLFSGTPCQIGGLYKYLQSEYENLITIDLTCHGVPSKSVFEKYRKEISQYTNSEIKFFNWRYKGICWKPNYLEIQFKNGENLIEVSDCNGFSRGFLKNLFLRPSCYDCKYNKLPRVADITLGDFFGYEGILKEQNKNQGLSLAVISTQKGKRLFEAIKKNIVYQASTQQYAEERNYHLNHAPFYNYKREDFFKDFYSGKTYAELAQEYLDLNIYENLDFSK